MKIRDKYKYLIKALRGYRITRYGQYDQESHHKVTETQDAADALEDALNTLSRCDDEFMRICNSLNLVNTEERARDLQHEVQYFRDQL